MANSQINSMDWLLFKGDGVKKDIEFPSPPPWRDFTKTTLERRGETFHIDAGSPEGKSIIEMVNISLYLRKPLIVTGPPGSGKSSLAYAVAHELNLGEVLKWPINSKSNLNDALYTYDAVSRLRDITIGKKRLEIAAKNPAKSDDFSRIYEEDIGRYIRLGPLGTALYSKDKPRVLLIDEIDKGDIDLTNDLLHVFEEGEFIINELFQLSLDQQNDFCVMPFDGKKKEDMIDIERGGKVTCGVFPLVFMTNNGERDFPEAFLRRCLRLTMKPPRKELLKQIIYHHLPEAYNKDHDNIISDLIDNFFDIREAENDLLSTDQLINTVQLLGTGLNMDNNTRKNIEMKMFSPLKNE